MTARRSTDTPMMMTVTAGRTTLGFILRRGENVFEAFDRAERSLGVLFKDQRSAADAISGEVAP
jgi:hypothetical protein